MEQEAICIRYINKSLEIVEAFVGLFNPPDTTGETLSIMVRDVLTRFNLPLENLRAQTYDGAANMSGIYSGCQALIAKDNPLALYFHCSAHCANLAAEHTANACPLVRDALQCVNDVGVLYKRSGKFKNIFDIGSANVYETPTTLKPICPTRWLCRYKSICTVLDQYEAVLCSLEEMSGSSKTDTATKAAGLLARFQQGSTVCGLKIASQLFGPLEQLNRSLQSTSITMSGMIEAAETVVAQLQMLRTDEAFNQLLGKVTEMVVEHNLEPVSLPRQRRPPKRLTGAADAYFADTVEVFYRTIFFEVVDTAVNQLGKRFDRSHPGLSRYINLEQVLLSGIVDAAICQQYPEFDGMTLAIQLQMFRSSYPAYASLSDAQQLLQIMVPEVRLLFTQVEQLVRLLLLCPVSSCSAERSFSALRRLKNWLRSTMSQIRLNSVAVCHVNQHILDLLDLRLIAAEFTGRSDIRRGIFGSGQF
jgi:hypothetical protein